ncbi:hypothetical protein CN446_08135 [Bacillus cereus]|nr:hypothetical protein CN446_08135 [Bacillus cereus]PGU57576.1 hypothetical protein COD70_14335 [Bacillus cereus]
MTNPVIGLYRNVIQDFMQKRIAGIPRILAITTMYKILYKRYIDRKTGNLVNTRILFQYLLLIIGRYVNLTCIGYTTKTTEHINPPKWYNKEKGDSE